MGNITPTSVFATETVCLSVCIVIEAILVFLIVDMARWNDFTKAICTIAIMDICAFLIDLIFNTVWYVTSPKKFFLFQDLEYTFLCLTIIASSITSLGIFFLLWSRELFNPRLGKSRFVLVFAVLVPIICYVVSTVSYNKFVTDIGDDNYVNDDKPFSNPDFNTYYIFSNILYYYTIALIAMNFGIFFLSMYQSFRLSQTLGKTMQTPLRSDPSSAQNTISILVGRVKYYPIIQSFLFVIFTVSYNYYTVWHKNPGLNVLFILPPLAYLLLFLRMQPQALQQLHYRLGMGTCPLRSTKLAQLRVAGSSGAFNTDVGAQQTTDVAFYDDMEDEDLSSIVSESTNDSRLESEFRSNTSGL